MGFFVDSLGHVIILHGQILASRNLTLSSPVCTFKTSSCVVARHVHMCLHIWTCYWYTRGRFGLYTRRFFSVSLYTHHNHNHNTLSQSHTHDYDRRHTTTTTTTTHNNTQPTNCSFIRPNAGKLTRSRHSKNRQTD